MQGRITEKSRKKRWGYIAGDDGNTYVFQYKGIDPVLLARMQQQDTVIFEPGRSRKGTLIAKDVRRYVREAD